MSDLYIVVRELYWARLAFRFRFRERERSWACVGKLLREPEHLEQNLDWNQSEEEFEPSHNLEHTVELSDLLLVPREEFRGENICPENVVLAERYLQMSIKVLQPTNPLQLTCRLTGSA
jgi:hypothetical protein